MRDEGTLGNLKSVPGIPREGRNVAAAPTRDIDDALTMLYGQDAVSAIITLKVDTKEADRIASQVAKFTEVLDVFLVTGDTDIIVKTRFTNYRGLKDFVMKMLAPIPGIKDTKTLMVVTTYKEAGAVREVG